jgi:hypothetical protein
MPRMYRSLKAYCTTLSPPHVLDVPTSAARCLHARNDARDPSSERWKYVGENVPVILPKWRLPRHLGTFYMPQIYAMGPTALLPLRRKPRWGLFRPEKSWRLRPGLNPRTWVLKGSKLPLDHRSRFWDVTSLSNGKQIPMFRIGVSPLSSALSSSRKDSSKRWQIFSSGHDLTFQKS